MFTLSEDQCQHTSPSQPVDSFLPATQEEIKKIIMNSRTKSCTLDPTPTFLLKECITELLPTSSEYLRQICGLLVHKEAFKESRNKLTHTIKGLKGNHIQDKINNSKESQPTLFKCLEELLYKSKVTALPTNICARNMQFHLKNSLILR